MDNEREFIVAEVSKNWSTFEPASDLLCQRFETIIEYNRLRGYILHSFQLHRLMTRENELNETIIAVFRRMGGDRG